MAIGALKRELTNAEKTTLKQLNDAITRAIAERTEWLDQKMNELCKFKLGDEIVNMATGRLLGWVSRPYRYTQNILHDNSLAIDLEYRTDDKLDVPGGGSFDNTSRQGFIEVGTREEYEADRLSEAKRILAEGGYCIKEPRGGGDE